MGDRPDKFETKSLNKMTKKERTERGRRLANNGSLEETIVQDEVSVLGLKDISSYAEDDPGCSKKKQRSKCGGETNIVQGVVKEIDEDFVQDQIIIAPEIMSLILKKLDLRSLKKTRLVCKSWLVAAQPHFERRAVVRFHRKGCTVRIKLFQEIVQKEVLHALPQPFRDLDVDLNDPWDLLPDKVFFQQLQAIIRPPLILTRFSPGNVPLKLALPVVIHCSSSLEDLMLEADSCKADYLPPMDPEQKFPKLRLVRADIPKECHNAGARWKYFPSVVAWIVNGSPNLEILDSECIRNVELGSELLLKLNVNTVKNVKKLVLSHYTLNRAASTHFLSIPFTRLEHLELYSFKTQVSSSWGYHGYVALEATVLKSANTLKKLELSSIEQYLPHDRRTISEFPVCPNLEELTLDNFHNWKHVIPKSFPALRVLNVSTRLTADYLLGDLWRDLSPFLGIKILRANFCHVGYGQLAIKFLQKFPELERLGIQTSAACCRRNVNAVPRVLNTVERAYLLNLRNLLLFQLNHMQPGGGKGKESITMLTPCSTKVVHIPLSHFPSLKVIEFEWSPGMDFEKLLEMARKVEKVIITNCCSDQTLEDQQSQELLHQFFESAPNVECGCGKGGKLVQ